MRRGQEQGGSIAGFLVTCAILALLLVGGVYAVRHAGWFGSTAGTAEPSRDVASDGTQPSGKDKDDTKDEKASADRDTSSDDRSSDTSDETSHAQTPSNPDTSVVPQTGVDRSTNELPQTGPAETAASLAALVFLTVALTAFYRSIPAEA